MKNIVIIPTKIKTGFYLLIPKVIAELTNVRDDTEFSIIVNISSTRPSLSIIQNHHTKRKSKTKQRRK